MFYKEFTTRFLKMLSVVGLLFATNNVQSQIHHHDGDSLGVVKFSITCGEVSQTEFNQAMVLLHHMTYPQAREKFKRIVENDSTCAMAYWGIAMTLFQPLWPTRPGPRELQQGWDAIQKAKSISPVTERERLLINAAEAFFQDPKSADYWKRIQAWKERMEIAYSSFPKDHEVASLFALALLATIPPNQISSSNNSQAAEILLQILKENPNHPGAMHYLIHANDTPGRERESFEILSNYKLVAPHNPHALHMPTHIYTRLGEWAEVISGNLKAAEAALEFPAGDKGQYIWDEFPHAIEYLIYALLQTGADDEAFAQLKRLQETDRLEPTFKTAFHLSSTRARYTLERRAWTEAASIDPRVPETIDWNLYPWPEAIGWFTRGFGSIHIGNSTEAKKSQQRLIELEAIALKKNEILFSRNIQVLRLELTAWIVDKEGLGDSSVTLLTQAAELETSTPKHPVTPAPTLPAYELLGDLLFTHGKYQEALNAYQHSLEINPGRFNSLLGTARSLVTIDSTLNASTFYRQLIEMSDPKSKRDGLVEARSFLSK